MLSNLSNISKLKNLHANFRVHEGVNFVVSRQGKPRQHLAECFANAPVQHDKIPSAVNRGRCTQRISTIKSQKLDQQSRR